MTIDYENGLAAMTKIAQSLMDRNGPIGIDALDVTHKLANALGLFLPENVGLTKQQIADMINTWAGNEGFSVSGLSKPLEASDISDDQAQDFVDLELGLSQWGQDRNRHESDEYASWIESLVL
jgi:hypothetical protein